VTNSFAGEMTEGCICVNWRKRSF